MSAQGDIGDDASSNIVLEAGGCMLPFSPSVWATWLCFSRSCCSPLWNFVSCKFKGALGSEQSSGSNHISGPRGTDGAMQNCNLLLQQPKGKADGKLDIA